MQPKTRQLLLTMGIVGAVVMAMELWLSPPKGQPASQTSPAEAANPRNAKNATPTKGANPPGQNATKRPAGSQPTAAERRAAERTAEIRTKSFVATLTNLNASVKSFKLNERRFSHAGKPFDLVSTDRESYLPLALELDGVTIPPDAVWEMETLSPTAVRFRLETGGVEIVRKLEAGRGPYQLWSTVRITALEGQRRIGARVTTHHYVPRSAEAGGMFAARSPAISHGVCSHQGSVERLDREKLLQRHVYDNAGFAALENAFFVQALADGSQTSPACKLLSTDRGGTREDPHGSLFEAALVYPSATLATGASRTIRTLGYLGPKSTADLNAAGQGLPEVIDLGFFSSIARYLVALLTFIQGLVGNWGIAIILMTVLVKLVLFPLTAKSFQSMARMRELKPELDKLNDLYGDDREKKGAATMELYRRHKINPLGGCLPQLLQLPIWWALYTSLSTNVELYGAHFALWWTDLSAPDPYFVLPLALGVLMWVQQKITPAPMDPMQAKMMLWMMPIMITVFMLFLPAGLCLYMFTNSVLTIGQQKLIEHVGSKPTETVAAGEEAKDTPPSSPATPSPVLPGPGPRRTRSGRA